MLPPAGTDTIPTVPDLNIRRLAAVIVLLLLAAAFAQPAEEVTFGYEEGRITAIDTATNTATVELNDGRTIQADLGQPLPQADVGPELPDFRVGQRVETYWYLGAGSEPV